MNITKRQLAKAWLLWSESDKVLRFGQYVWNEYGEEPWPELFYETNPNKAYLLLFDKATDEVPVEE